MGEITIRHKSGEKSFFANIHPILTKIGVNVYMGNSFPHTNNCSYHINNKNVFYRQVKKHIKTIKKIMTKVLPHLCGKTLV